MRRAARIAGRTGAHLVGVHVVSPGESPGPDLERQRRLLVGLGGVYREIVGDAGSGSVADALAAFARVEQATQLVIGARPGHAVRVGEGGDRRTAPSWPISSRGSAASMCTSSPPRSPQHHHNPSPRPAVGGVERPAHLRRIAWALCIIGLPLLTAILASVRRHVPVGTALMFDLCLVMAIAALGGLRAGPRRLRSRLRSHQLVPRAAPAHRDRRRRTERRGPIGVRPRDVRRQLSGRSRRGRSREAATARAEAAALARSAATLVGAHDPLPDLLEQLRATFGLASASVFERTSEGWWPTHASGHPQLLDPTDGTSIDISPDGTLLLVVSDNALRPEQLEVLRAVRRPTVDGRRGPAAARRRGQRRVVVGGQRVARRPVAGGVARLPHAARNHQGVGLRTAAHRRRLLRCRSATLLGDDRRTPPTGSTAWSRDLLDMSRLQAGALDLTLRSVALEEVVAAALGSLAAPRRDGSKSTCPSPCRPCWRDAALLERAVANLVSQRLGVVARRAARCRSRLARSATASTCGSSTAGPASPPTTASASSSRSSASATGERCRRRARPGRRPRLHRGDGGALSSTTRRAAA